jgi:hypothetical protein
MRGEMGLLTDRPTDQDPEDTTIIPEDTSPESRDKKEDTILMLRMTSRSRGKKSPRDPLKRLLHQETNPDLPSKTDSRMTLLDPRGEMKVTQSEPLEVREDLLEENSEVLQGVVRELSKKENLRDSRAGEESLEKAVWGDLHSKTRRRKGALEKEDVSFALREVTKQQSAAWHRKE